MDSKMHLALREERRVYTCAICGTKREIRVLRIEKWVAVCAHEDTRGDLLPTMQLREEGVLLTD